MAISTFDTNKGVIMNRLLSMYNRCKSLPFGNTIFSILVSTHAPYFRTIRPRFTVFQPGHVEVTIKKRWGVLNHLKTVHAIAMCNMCEFAAGTMTEATLSSSLRWIPEKMSVEYLKLAKTDLKAICSVSEQDLNKPQHLEIPVHVYDINDQLVFRAVITMYISEKSKR